MMYGSFLLPRGNARPSNRRADPGICGNEREREKERKKERERERERERETDRQTDRQTETDREARRNIQTEKRSAKRKCKPGEKYMDRHATCIGHCKEIGWTRICRD